MLDVALQEVGPPSAAVVTNVWVKVGLRPSVLPLWDPPSETAQASQLSKEVALRVSKASHPQQGPLPTEFYCPIHAMWVGTQKSFSAGGGEATQNPVIKLINHN